MIKESAPKTGEIFFRSSFFFNIDFNVWIFQSYEHYLGINKLHQSNY